MKTGLILVCAVVARAAEPCVMAPVADAWRALDRPPRACAAGAREKLLTPRIDRGVETASATRSPWIVANGWRFIRKPAEKYVYDKPGQAAGLAAAEGFAYGADVGLGVTGPEIEAAAPMMAFLQKIPALDLPGVADIGVIDDGSPAPGEVLNLLARRNLLFA
ncbi:MAG: hypothetical protein ACRD8O_18145, partial [Bryobacteraceae bacterium]